MVDLSKALCDCSLPAESVDFGKMGLFMNCVRKDTLLVSVKLLGFAADDDESSSLCEALWRQGYIYAVPDPSQTFSDEETEYFRVCDYTNEPLVVIANAMKAAVQIKESIFSKNKR